MTTSCGTRGRDRILVVGNPFVGDTVLAVPVLRNLRRAFPSHAIDLLAEGRVPADLLHACPFIDAILPWERPAKRPVEGLPMEVRGRGVLASLSNAVTCGAVLRQRRYERAYLLKRSPSAAVLAFRAGIPHRIGHAAALVRPLLTRTAPLLPDRHRIDADLDLLRADGLAVDDGRLEVWPETAALADVDRLIAPLPPDRPRVFLAVTASDWRRRWPLSRWAAVIHRTVEELGCEVVICGDPHDTDVHTLLRAAAAGHVHDLSAAVPLRQVTALMSRMDLFVGVESGPMHLAAACGLPTVALFDPRKVAEWHPRGPRTATICGTAASRRGLAGRLRRREAAQPDGPWPTGTMLDAVSVPQVVDRIAAFLPAHGRTTLAATVRIGRGSYDAAAIPAATAVPAT